MSEPSWWRCFFKRKAGHTPSQTTADPKQPELREFIYLDEVSLLSLLSSQKGEVIDSKSEQAGLATEATIDAMASVNAGVLGKGEIASRYQTNNSSSIQTSRKATVQSLFRDLHSIDGLRLIEPVMVDKSANGIEDLIQNKVLSRFAPVAELRRGKLVEFRIKLSADPVFRLGTMVSEFTSMAEDYPEMFGASGELAALQEMQPVNKILKRLLVGLVPIRGVAIDYVVIEVEGDRFVVHKHLVDGLGLKSKPLEIVGVTDQEAYWKDLRRVLFSDAEFTAFARIAHSGLRDTWTPVKLAELFTDVAPNLVEQINDAGRVPLSGSPSELSESAPESKLAAALSTYVELLLGEIGKSLKPNQKVAVNLCIEKLKERSATVSDQSSAFSTLTQRVLGLVGGKIDSTRALDLRTTAREKVGLSLFPGASLLNQSPPAALEREGGDESLLLDVEFVAIYW